MYTSLLSFTSPETPFRDVGSFRTAIALKLIQIHKCKCFKGIHRGNHEKLYLGNHWTLSTKHESIVYNMSPFIHNVASIIVLRITCNINLRQFWECTKIKNCNLFEWYLFLVIVILGVNSYAILICFEPLKYQANFLTWYWFSVGMMIVLIQRCMWLVTRVRTTGQTGRTM